MKLVAHRPLRPGCILALCALVLMPACGATEGGEVAINQSTTDSSSETVKVVRWKLPKALREVSGLALDSQGSVFAVADEEARVFKLDAVTGEMLAVFSLGRPALRGDFEGIAWLNDWLYLITSDGVLLRTQPGLSDTAIDGTALNFERFELATQCEIEGLTEDLENPWLWIACKEVTDSEAKASEALRLYAWDTAQKTLVAGATRELPTQRLLELTDQKRFKPSGLSFIPADPGAILLIISGAQRAWSTWRWSAEPALVAAGRLPKAHRQPEGVAVTQAGELLLADEGKGKAARLRVYPKGHSLVAEILEAIDWRLLNR